MGYYKYVAKLWKRPWDDPLKELVKKRLIMWRKEPTVVRIKKPTRINRARSLGYKAKPGYIIVRVRVRKGGLNRPRPRSGRRPKRMGVYGYSPHKSSQQIAEERASKKYPNMVVLGSYWVGEDGVYRWYEIVMADPEHPAIKNDPERMWISGYIRKIKKKIDINKIIDKIG